MDAWVIGTIIVLLFGSLFITLGSEPRVKTMDRRCVHCGHDTIYEFCGRPMCPTCKGHLADHAKGTNR